MQVYATAPREHDVPSCFHRTIFVFICHDPKCCRTNRSDNFVVLRSQLPRQNEFYPDVRPSEDDFNPQLVDYPRADRYQTLCSACGCAGSKRCGKCHRTFYCSKDHQVADWKAGHKLSCAKGDFERVSITFCSLSRRKSRNQMFICKLKLLYSLIMAKQEFRSKSTILLTRRFKNGI